MRRRRRWEGGDVGVKEEVGGAAGVKTFVCFMVTLAAG